MMRSTEMKKHSNHTSIFALQFSDFCHTWKMQVCLYISYKSGSCHSQNKGGQFIYLKHAGKLLYILDTAHNASLSNF